MNWHYQILVFHISFTSLKLDLTLFHTILIKRPHNPDKTLWEKDKMLVISVFSFSHNVFNPSKKEFLFSVTFILSSANDFNLDQSKNLSLGKELTETR